MPPPSFDQHLGFGEAVEDLAIEQFVAKRSIEAFVWATQRGGQIKAPPKADDGKADPDALIKQAIPPRPSSPPGHRPKFAS